MLPRRALYVINERSRKGSEGGDEIARQLAEGGIELQRESCRNPDELAGCIRRAAGKLDLVVLGGGDGTLNSAAPALVEAGLPLGIVPLGNVASRLSTRMTRELTHDVKQRWGMLGYGLATFRALRQTRPFHAEIRSGGIDDGCLNLYSLELDRLWKLALVYPAFRKGRHGLWKEVRTMRCEEVEIRTRRPRSVNTDGEIATETPARFRILREAISVIAPAVQPRGDESAKALSDG